MTNGWAKLHKEMEEWLRGRPDWQSKHWNYLITHIRYTNGIERREGEIETTYAEIIRRIGLRISVETLQNHYRALKELGIVSVRQKGHKTVIALNHYRPEVPFSENHYRPESLRKPFSRKEKQGRAVQKTTDRTTVRSTVRKRETLLNTDACDTPKKEERRKNIKPPLPPLKNRGKIRDDPKIGSHDHFYGKAKK